MKEVKQALINLRKQIYSLLKLIHPRIYFQNAPVNAEFPYVVYDLPNSFTIENVEVFDLDIDIWDNSPNTSEIESLNSLIWKKLNKHKHIDENIQFSIYRSNRNNIRDDDKTIKRKKLIFNIRYYNRSDH